MNIEKEQQAIKWLQLFEPKAEEEPYYLAYSGGKDSDAILILAELAGVRYEAVHNHTTVDAPETVYYVRSKPNVRINYPALSMWRLIVKKLMPPTRISRYCCEEIKEHGGEGRRVVTGVRRAESVRRRESVGLAKILGKPKTTQQKAEELGAEYRVTKQGGLILNNDNTETRELVEHCVMRSKVMINPIYDWTDEDVWEFLGHYGCKSNPLYECGFKRIGCIGCPMVSKHRYLEFARYPKYKENYIRAFDRMLQHRRELGKPAKDWETGIDVFRWWMEEDFRQVTFDDLRGE
ncbi:phosphoadenosine phosphosulfate reductase family protein [Ruminococcus sp. 210702-SL.1.03]|uniref:phosphoadenosine phosphosulfate reductase family protein n=1 Tax=Ruminococcus sp. 210702-SL.1.03 TaxID=2883233 RepID=UPI001D062674|nr:phosphoadenosine phosphosulfate reductase family protein [Ruminococcus sp. 210702-SL.1.03]MCB6617286.1 phosphoadenosine phosphosulfate reductase family protein [Ruminococcus sp. 210702-SL.1.03]